MRAILFAAALLLAACATPQRLEGSGTVAPAPIGHTVACTKNPDLAGCPK